jgi:hypothetical protein
LVTAVAAAQLDGRPVVISGSADKTIRVWDLAAESTPDRTHQLPGDDPLYRQVVGVPGLPSRLVTDLALVIHEAAGRSCLLVIALAGAVF